MAIVLLTRHIEAVLSYISYTPPTTPEAMSRKEFVYPTVRTKPISTIVAQFEAHYPYRLKHIPILFL